MLFCSIRYDFTILRCVLMALIPLKQYISYIIKIIKISIGSIYFHFLSNNLVVSYQYFLIILFPLVFQGFMRLIKKYAYSFLTYTR